MDNLKERNQEAYKRLAQVDFKCLENEIYKITGHSAKIIKKHPVPEEYKYKCKREEDIKTVFEKLFKIIAPAENEECDYIGKCMARSNERNERKGTAEDKGHEGCKTCRACKGYWFTTDETFASFYEMWKEWKADKNGMDPDDSDCESNPFLRAVYYLLWGKKIELGEETGVNGQEPAEEKTCIYKNGFSGFRTSYLFPEMVWGGDTMNTLLSYKKTIDSLLEKDRHIFSEVNTLSRRCHQLGNFVLVPAYFNGWRGFNSSIQDRMDLSLSVLNRIENEQDEKNSFCFKTEFRKRIKKNTDSNWEIARKTFAGWRKSKFTNYINLFFLWDYVKPKNETEYSVKDMTKGVSEESTEDEQIDQIREENAGQYIANANTYIKRRGIFMAAMLEIAVEFKDIKTDMPDHKEEWKEKRGDWNVSDIYKCIVKKVFLTDKTYSDYDKVIDAIQAAIKENMKTNEAARKDISNILDNAQKRMEETGADDNDTKRSD